MFVFFLTINVFLAVTTLSVENMVILFIYISFLHFVVFSIVKSCMFRNWYKSFPHRFHNLTLQIQTRFSTLQCYPLLQG